ncbi:MAG: hypothetical protein ACP5U1_02405 [Desulfomonilaceae bacterium]
MPDSITIPGAIVLALIGVANTVIMAETLGRRGGPAVLRAVHKWLGRLFMFMFIIFFIYMLPRLASFENTPVVFIAHGFLAMIVFILLFSKFLIVRRYKSYMSSVGLIGLYIMIGILMVVMCSAGVEVLGHFFR